MKSGENPVGFPWKPTGYRLQNRKMQTEESGSEDAVDDLEVIAALISSLIELIPLLPQEKKRRKRIRKINLPYHKRRRRVDWAQWVRELGPTNFY